MLAVDASGNLVVDGQSIRPSNLSVVQPVSQPTRSSGSRENGLDSNGLLISNEDLSGTSSDTGTGDASTRDDKIGTGGSEVKNDGKSKKKSAATPSGVSIALEGVSEIVFVACDICIINMIVS